MIFFFSYILTLCTWKLILVSWCIPIFGKSRIKWEPIYIIVIYTRNSFEKTRTMVYSMYFIIYYTYYYRMTRRFIIASHSIYFLKYEWMTLWIRNKYNPEFCIIVNPPKTRLVRTTLYVNLVIRNLHLTVKTRLIRSM